MTDNTYWFIILAMRIIDALKSHQKNQLEFAREIGIHHVYLNSIIKGRRRPSPDLALRIEEATGGAVTRMELLYPEEKEQNKGGQPNENDSTR